MKKINKLVGMLVVGILVGVGSVDGAIIYVAKDGANIAPYDSWENAATDLDVVLDTHSPYGSNTVIIGDGIWKINQCHDMEFDIRSLNGPYNCSIDLSEITSIDQYHSYILNGQYHSIDGISFINANVNGKSSCLINQGIVQNCIFYNNSIWTIIQTTSVTINNCIFYKNNANCTVSVEGDGILQNCLFIDNYGNVDGAGDINISGGIVENAIVKNSLTNWGAVGFSNGDQRAGVLNNSCIQGIILTNSYGSPVYCSNIITNDPVLDIVSEPLNSFGAAGNSIPHFYLSSNSPCIDMGLYNTNMDNETDIEGRDRVVGASVDMGPNEYGAQERFTVVATKGNSDTSILVTWKWHQYNGHPWYYQVYRSVNNQFSSAAHIATTTNNWYIDNDPVLVSGVPYHYWIRKTKTSNDKIKSDDELSKTDYGYIINEKTGPIIKANKKNLIQGEELVVTAQILDPSPYENVPVDYWILAYSGQNNSWWCYNSNKEWVQVFDKVWFAAQGPFVKIDPVTILNISNLTPGAYMVFFAVDNMDGTLDVNNIWYDFVRIEIQ